MTFDDFFRQATGRVRHPYQRAFTEAGELPELFNITTGAGKTATVILGWLYRRRPSGQTNRDIVEAEGVPETTVRRRWNRGIITLL